MTDIRRLLLLLLLLFHWSARRSSDASCPAICPSCLDMSQGLKAWSPVCKASLIPIELKIHLLKMETSCLHYVKALWKLVTLEARNHKGFPSRALYWQLWCLHHWRGSFSAVSAFLHHLLCFIFCGLISSYFNYCFQQPFLFFWGGASPTTDRAPTTFWLLSTTGREACSFFQECHDLRDLGDLQMDA